MNKDSNLNSSFLNKDKQLIDNLAQESLTASHKPGTHTTNVSPTKKKTAIITGGGDAAIKIYDDRSDHTFGNTFNNEDFKKQISINIPNAPIGNNNDDNYDQVKFKESQSELSQFINTHGFPPLNC